MSKGMYKEILNYEHGDVTLLTLCLGKAGTTIELPPSINTVGCEPVPVTTS